MTTRRDFIALLGGSAVAWPMAARAQQAGMPVIGLVSSGSPEPNASRLDVFRKGLKIAGVVEGRNAGIEYRWASDNYNQLPVFAAELVSKPVDLIVSFDNTATALAMKAATSTIPIVFSIGTDPVKFGLVRSLSRPGGNITGVVSLTVGLGVKRLEVMRELLPNAGTIALLMNPQNPAAESESAAVLAAAQTVGQNLTILKASREAEIDSTFVSAAQLKTAGIVVISEPFLTTHRHQIAALAAKYSLPVIDAYREYVDGGGLMSYGASAGEARRILGIYAGRILKGEQPADLPVWQSTKIELVINLKVAQALGLKLPTSLLVRADEVIE